MTISPAIARAMPTLTLSIFCLVAGVAHAAPAAHMMNGMLVTNDGMMTLYSFDKDVAGSGKSACNGPCAALWPPATATTDAKPDGDFSVVTRDDGSRQWAYKGKPVYLYSGDKKTGDVTGDNFKDIWHVVR